MAIADIFLKIQGITGEASAPGHEGDMAIVSWSWGMQASTPYTAGTSGGQASMRSLDVVKLVDRASPTLLQYLDMHKLVSKATLTVRKSGSSAPVEYLVMDMTKVRIVMINHGTQDAEVTEHVSLSFETISFTYTPQAGSGDPGSSGITFTATHPATL
jgi:type VI secretion system secreted protein Hcp